MKYSLKDKVIVITGASAGIGKHLAMMLAKEGAKISICARNADKLTQTVDEILSAGGVAFSHPCDVTKEEDCREFIEKTKSHFGHIDVLINNAGVDMGSLFRDIRDLSIYEKMMRINFFGTVYTTYYAIEEIVKNRGMIVGISSLTGKTGVPTRTAYASTKWAMYGFFNSLRIEMMPEGVHIMMVAPGYVSSDFRKSSLAADGSIDHSNPEYAKEVRGDIKELMPTDVAVRMIIDGMKNKKREIIMTPRGKLIPFLSWIAPGLMDKIALKTIEETRE